MFRKRRIQNMAGSGEWASDDPEGEIRISIDDPESGNVGDISEEELNMLGLGSGRGKRVQIEEVEEEEQTHAQHHYQPRQRQIVQGQAHAQHQAQPIPHQAQPPVEQTLPVGLPPELTDAIGQVVDSRLRAFANVLDRAFTNVEEKLKVIATALGQLGERVSKVEKKVRQVESRYDVNQLVAKTTESIIRSAVESLLSRTLDEVTERLKAETWNIAKNVLDEVQSRFGTDINRLYTLLSTKVTTLENRMNELETRIDTLIAKLGPVEKIVEASEGLRKLEDITSLRVTVTRLETNVTTLKAEVDNLKDSINSLRTEIEELKEQVSELAKTCVQMRNILDNVKKIIDTLYRVATGKPTS